MKNGKCNLLISITHYANNRFELQQYENRKIRNEIPMINY